MARKKSKPTQRGSRESLTHPTKSRPRRSKSFKSSKAVPKTTKRRRGRPRKPRKRGRPRLNLKGSVYTLRKGTYYIIPQKGFNKLKKLISVKHLAHIPATKL